MSLHDQRGALDVLPSLKDLDGSNSEQNKQVALKTGTDDQLAIAYNPAYKKLTKKADSGCHLSSSHSTTKDSPMQVIQVDDSIAKSLEIAHLGAKKNPLSSYDNSGLRSEAEGTRTLL